MTGKKNYNGPAFLVAALLLLLVPFCAYLQYTWLGQLSEQEFERMQANVRRAAFHFSADFTQELIAVLRTFGGRLHEPHDQLAAEVGNRIDQWHSMDSHSPLVGTVYLLTRPDDQEAPPEVYSASAGRFVPDTARRHSQRWWHRTGDSSQTTLVRIDRESSVFLFKDLSAFSIPVSSGSPVYRFSSVGKVGKDRWEALVVVTLNQQYLVDEFIPALGKTYFSTGGKMDYDFIIVGHEPPHTVWYRSAPDVPMTRFEHADAAVPFAYLRPFPLSLVPSNPLIRQPGEMLLNGDGQEFRRGADDSVVLSRFPYRFARPSASERLFSREPTYDMRVKYRSGSLEAAVARNRVRNLAVSFGILLLLAASVVFMLVSAGRSQRLARQQMEFVAGVSHELRTPIAVLKSAGDNLADGVIADPARAQAYGQLIRSEVGRLSGMIENALEYASIRSGRKSYEVRPSGVQPIIYKAVATCDGIITREGFHIDVTLPRNLHPVMVDAPGLQTVLENLILNAIKYSGDSRWVGIEASEDESNGGQVLITVRDRGFGIEPRDIKHIFQPFYRGKNARDAGLQGSGLGLSLADDIIRAFDGRITVESVPGKGSAFTVHLPVPENGAAGGNNVS